MPDIDEGQDVSIRTSRFNPQPYAPYDLVNDRFTKSLETADKMLELMIGEDGESGYLGVMSEFLDLNAHNYTIDAEDVDTSFSPSTIGDAPTFNDALIDSFPDFTKADPALKEIPSVDLADLSPPDEPDDINPQIIWSELVLNQDIYQQLLSRIQTDIVDGATGLNADVEEALFESGRSRQQRENDRTYRELNNDLEARGDLVPSGGKLGALTDLAEANAEKVAELNRTITIEQARLAQSNSQFIIQQAAALETLLRDTRHKDSDRALDYAKSVAQLTLQVYSEKVRMYIAVMEGKKIYVEAQVANLQAIVSYNIALIEEYKAHLEAFGIQVNAIGSKNSSLVDVYRGKIDGYAAHAGAVATLDGVKLEKIKTDVAAADLDLRAAIAEVEANIRAWGTEYELKSSVSKAMTDIAVQALIGAFNSVHANAGMSYQGSESRNENWSQSKSLSETHNYQEDPAVE